MIKLHYSKHRQSTGSIVYKYADYFRCGKDTYHTESFNNTVNMFQDKRIAFGDMQYSLK